MRLMNLFRRAMLARDLDRRLRARKAARQAHAAASLRGVSTQWKRRAQACKAVFGGEA